MAGWVYFISAPAVAMVKIGYTGSHPDERLKRLRATCPCPLIPLGLIEGPITLESELHGRFLPWWSHGEWFKADAVIIDYIRSHAVEWLDPLVKFVRRLPVSPSRETRGMPRIAISKEMERFAKKKTMGVRIGKEMVSKNLFDWSVVTGLPVSLLRQHYEMGYRSPSAYIPSVHEALVEAGRRESQGDAHRS